MDQARIAGIGNTYADEILFQARLHPGMTAHALDAAMRHRLFDAMKHVLRTAIDRGAGAEKFTDRLPKGFPAARAPCRRTLPSLRHELGDRQARRPHQLPLPEVPART